MLGQLDQLLGQLDQLHERAIEEPKRSDLPLDQRSTR